MSHPNKFGLIAIVVLVLATMTCNLGPLTISLNSPSGNATPAAKGAPSFSAITFAEDVTDDGAPVKPGTKFSGDVEDVWALWNFDGIKNGTTWRREWKRDGKIVAGIDGTWEDDESGWVAYSLSDDADVESGNYTFNLYIEGQLVQQGTFSISAKSPAMVEKLKQSSFGPITICEDYTEDGQPVKPHNSFPSGTTEVVALVNYKNMVHGQTWGRLWEKDGKEYVSKMGQTWDKESDGWRAYSLTDEDGLEGGHYTLTLFIGDQAVQRASFDVAAGVHTPASFGPITFAQGINEDRTANGAATTFDPTITKVYAIFPYTGMATNQAWSKEWSRDGNVFDRGDFNWDGQAEGITYLYVGTTDNKPLTPGKYTLNVYLNGKVARSASFVINAPAATRPPTLVPARPQDLMSPEMITLWSKLANIQGGAAGSSVQYIAQIPLKYHIPIQFTDLPKGALGEYVDDAKKCKTVPGKVEISRTYVSQLGPDVAASVMAHELTHAMNALEGHAPCHCTVEDEYYAHAVELYVLWQLGKWQWVDQQFVYVFDANGHFNGGLLWNGVKSQYKECPDR